MDKERIKRFPNLENVPEPNIETILTVGHLRTPYGWMMISVYKNGTYLLRNTTIPPARQSIDTIDELQDYPLLSNWVRSVIDSAEE
jgi:hypothetical protein